MVELVRTGRTAGELSREFECSAQAIRNWVRQADLDEGRRSDGLTTVERDELRRLRRENLQLREERKILKEAAAWLPGRPTRCRGDVRAREGETGRPPGGDDVPGAGGLKQRLLRVAAARARRREHAATASCRHASPRSTATRAGPTACRAFMRSYPRGGGRVAACRAVGVHGHEES